MKKLSSLKIAFCLTSALGVILAGSVAHADLEPWNEFEPWLQGVRVESLANKYGFSSFPGTIGFSGDVDYWGLTCSPMPRDGTFGDPGYVANVRIRLANGAGDLDMDVLGNNGYMLGMSHGYGSVEGVTVPGHYGTVYLKVVGWSGATGGYTIEYDCKWN